MPSEHPHLEGDPSDDAEPMTDEEKARLQTEIREIQEHGGGVVARRRDGANFYAADLAELYQLIVREQLSMSELVIEDIPTLGVTDVWY